MEVMVILVKDSDSSERLSANAGVKYSLGVI